MSDEKRATCSGSGLPLYLHVDAEGNAIGPCSWAAAGEPPLVDGRGERHLPLYEAAQQFNPVTQVRVAHYEWNDSRALRTYELRDKTAAELLLEQARWFASLSTELEAVR